MAEEEACGTALKNAKAKRYFCTLDIADDLSTTRLKEMLKSGSLPYPERKAITDTIWDRRGWWIQRDQAIRAYRVSRGLVP